MRKQKRREQYNGTYHFRKREVNRPISSIPLEDAIKEQIESGLTPFSDYFLKRPKRRENKYSTLPKRFSDPIQKLPKHVFVNVNRCMTYLYREGQDWIKEEAFKKLYSETLKYPYKELVESNRTTIEAIFESYWLYDMKYMDQKLAGMNYIIETEFRNDLRTSDNRQVNLIVKILCEVDKNGPATFGIYKIDLETMPALET
jgi:hypothetical protein